MSVDRLDFNEIMRIQNLMASRIAQEDEVNLKIKLLDIISELRKGSKKSIQIEEVLIEAQYLQIDEKTTMNYLDELVRDKMIMITDGKIIVTY